MYLFLVYDVISYKGTKNVIGLLSSCTYTFTNHNNDIDLTKNIVSCFVFRNMTEISLSSFLLFYHIMDGV